jgi:hypothetical protein
MFSDREAKSIREISSLVYLWGNWHNSRYKEKGHPALTCMISGAPRVQFLNRCMLLHSKFSRISQTEGAMERPQCGGKPR